MTRLTEQITALARRLLPLAALLMVTTTNVQGAGTAYVLDLEGALGVATAEFIIGGIDKAQANEGNIVIIRMDTPGGLVEPMRDIVQSILASNVPVVTYVSPGGARADSAGTYILYASHVAAMAPTTHLGAATPVSLVGGDPSEKEQPSSPFGTPPKPDIGDNTEPAPEGEAPDSESPASDAEADKEETSQPSTPGSAMERKVLNDAIAYIRGLAEAHGRNADWAEEAVVNAATLTATDALEMNVIDLIANDQAELLAAIDGREVKVKNAPFVISTDGIVVENVEPSWRLKVLNTIASPEIAVLLLMVGLYGLLFEGYNPGAIIPGVAGVICLLLAAYALQVLPVNYAGLALIVVGMLLIVAEAFAPSFGALGLGGIIAMIFGSILMFDSGIPGFGISITFVITLTLITGGLVFWLVAYLVKLRSRGAVSGQEAIVGGVGTAMDSFTGEGKVWLEGEAWTAYSNVPIAKDQQVVVRALDGLTVHVEPYYAAEGEPQPQT